MKDEKQKKWIVYFYDGHLVEVCAESRVAAKLTGRAKRESEGVKGADLRISYVKEKEGQ